MINELYLKNFKCFKNIHLPLSALTLLTGLNAAGKTSTLQALLLITQALEKNSSDSKIPLNGELVNLGSPGDVLFENAESNQICIKITSDSSRLEVNLNLESRNPDRSMNIENVNIEDLVSGFQANNDNIEDTLVLIKEQIKLNQFIKSLKNIVYLGISRVPLEQLYPIPCILKKDSANVGSFGQFAPWLFEVSKDELIDTKRLHPKETALNFRRQFNAWFNEIFPNAEADTMAVENTHFVKLLLRNNKQSEWRTPSNIGYGLSYAFPVLVAALLAKPGQILIIDSPEAHLHPQGQSRMGDFLAMISKCGIQVIIETHSDHLLNGIRIAVNKSSISNKEVSVLFFDSEREQVISPIMDSKGNLNEWPDGFFDQSEKDLSLLAGW